MNCFRLCAAIIVVSNLIGATSSRAQSSDGSDFRSKQFQALKLALEQRGLPVEDVQGELDGGLQDDAYQIYTWVRRATAEARGRVRPYTGHWRLRVTIARPGRDSSISCVAWIRFYTGTSRIQFLRTKNCEAVPSIDVQYRLRRGDLFGARPDLETTRYCRSLAPGAQDAGGDGEPNCQIISARARPDTEASKYEIWLKDVDVFASSAASQRE